MGRKSFIERVRATHIHTYRKLHIQTVRSMGTWNMLLKPYSHSLTSTRLDRVECMASVAPPHARYTYFFFWIAWTHKENYGNDDDDHQRLQVRSHTDTHTYICEQLIARYSFLLGYHISHRHFGYFFCSVLFC